MPTPSHLISSDRPLSTRLTPEQAEVVRFILEEKGNLITQAVAGSGKTTTMIEATLAWAKLHPTKTALMCAFNTRTKDALVEKLGPAQGIEARTLNSLGHRALGKICPSRLRVDGRKTHQLSKGIFPWGEQPDLARLISILKMTGWVPQGLFKTKGFVPDTNALIEDVIDAFDLDINTEAPEFFLHLRTLMERCITEGLSNGFVDFDDQLYLSVLWGAPFEKFALVVVDEVQDVNRLQRRLLELCLLPGGRIIGVGDRNQAIYAFRGAGHHSIDEFATQFKCLELPLTFCFRCPKQVILRAQRYVPQIQAPSWAPEGTVQTLSGIPSPNSFLQPTDVILCRNTKPLVSLCYALLRAKIPATILGKDIGDGLLALVKKVQRKDEVDLSAFSKRLASWHQAQTKSLQEKGRENKIASLEDKIETILCLVDAVEEEYGPYASSDGPPTISHLTQMIAQMFTPGTGRITLSTIHKAKGLEWPRVFFLDPHLIPSKWAKTTEAIQQENNCIYVAVTRAQSSLFYIKSEDFFTTKEQPNV